MFAKAVVRNHPRQKRALLALAILLMLLCWLGPAQAISFYSPTRANIPFRDAGGAATGLFGDNAGHTVADTLWIGTVEAPGLGKAFLWQETSVNGGLALIGAPGYRTYTGSLTIQASPACTLPAGTWEVYMVAGVPYLYLNGTYHPYDSVVITTGTFSIPVRDEYGKPVVGAVFHVEGITWGGNSGVDYGFVSSDANGMLTIPTVLSADLSYWFSQASAPAGYSPMAERELIVEMGETGFAAMLDPTYTVPMQYYSFVLNRSNPASTVSAAAPPKTGDDTPILPLLLCLPIFGGTLIAMMIGSKRTLARRRPKEL